MFSATTHGNSHICSFIKYADSASCLVVYNKGVTVKEDAIYV